jgi:serine/threonine protein kinase
MAMLTLPAFIDCLRRYRLLEAAQMAEVTERLQSRFPDAKDLARELMQRAWLTAYQVNQLLTGRGADLLLGSYVLLERLGEGGMGQVFKARHHNLGRIVALKLIRKDRLTDPSAVRRFQREIRAAAHLDHPHIVRAYDADECDGTHLLVMEYVEGGCDLARLVKLKGPLPAAEACELIRQAAVGLQHAHERGLVHRDIKPQNLLLCADDKTVKILDMGLARVHTPEADNAKTSTMTQEGALMGTPDYIAPEQALSSHDADIRADIYSLGCTFYYLLAGKVPFPGGSLMEKLLKHQAEEPQQLEILRPDVPPSVAAIVRQMMAKRPQDRFQTPADVARAVADPESVMRSGTESFATSRSDGSQTVPFVPSENSAQSVPLPDQGQAAARQWADAVQPLSSVALAARPAQAQLAQRRKLYLIAGAGGAGLCLLLILLLALPRRTGSQKTGGQADPGAPPPIAATDPPGPEEDWIKSGLDQEGFITTWLLLAPIPLDAGQSAADALGKEQVTDEAKLQPKAGDKVHIHGKELVWQKHTTLDYYFDFNAFLDKQTDDSVGYAASYIHADVEMKDVKLKTGSDDQALVYLNGKQVLKQPNARPLAKDQDTTEITLRKGVNVLLFKVINEKIEWAGCARFMDRDGKVIRNLTASLTAK